MNSIKYSFDSSDFDGKVILITGSSSGIGAGTAIHLAKLNANLVINGRDRERVRSVAEECRKLTKNKVLEVLVDLQDDSQVRQLVAKTVQTFGKIDVLINSAGIVGQSQITDPEYQQSFDRIISANLRSVVLLTHLVVPYLESSKGCVVNVSSITSLIPRKTWSAYGMSKSGIDFLTRALAMELGPKGIRVNAINPGIVITPMLQKLNNGVSFSEEEVKLFCQITYPMGRAGNVDDMSRVIEFLASDNSSFITGVVMPVDGGSIVSLRSRL